MSSTPYKVVGGGGGGGAPNSIEDIPVRDHELLTNLNASPTHVHITQAEYEDYPLDHLATMQAFAAAQG